jgi:hypothetical protein
MPITSFRFPFTKASVNKIIFISEEIGGGGAVTVNPTGNASVTANTSNPITFSAVASGTAAANRLSVVAINGRRRATLNTVTINGVSAAKAVGVLLGGSGNMISEIWYAENPSGTTADVVLTFSAATSGAWEVALFEVNGATTIPTDTDSASSGTASSLSISALTIPANGVAIIASGNAGDTVAITWTNATEYTDTNITEIRASSAYTSTSGTPTITCDGSDGNPYTIAGAAWGPA